MELLPMVKDNALLQTPLPVKISNVTVRVSSYGFVIVVSLIQQLRISMINPDLLLLLSSIKPPAPVLHSYTVIYLGFMHSRKKFF